MSREPGREQRAFPLGWSFTRRHSQPDVQLLPKTLSHSLFPFSPALLPPRPLTLGLSKLIQQGKGTARHKTWHKASRGTGSWEQRTPLPATYTFLGVFIHLAKSQPFPSVPLLILRLLSLLPQLLTAYSSLKYCQPPKGWTRTNSYSSCFPRNWEEKGQSPAHPLTSCTVASPLFPLPLGVEVKPSLKSEML